MRDDALKPVTEAVKEVVRQTIKEEFNDLKRDIKSGYRDIQEEKGTRQPVHEGK